MSPHVPATATGKLPIGTSLLRLSTQTWCQSGSLRGGINLPAGAGRAAADVKSGTLLDDPNRRPQADGVRISAATPTTTAARGTMTRIAGRDYDPTMAARLPYEDPLLGRGEGADLLGSRCFARPKRLPIPMIARDRITPALMSRRLPRVHAPIQRTRQFCSEGPQARP